MLRVYLLVPLAGVLLDVVGLHFPLPPGPLCDEGMVLFMEGGCDWGWSNVFFFSKGVLLLVLNVCFLVAARGRVKPWPDFLPHLLLLTAVVAWNPHVERCDSYYGHPNGSLAQMVVEGLAFALLGMALLGRARECSWRRLAVLALAWNAFHVFMFYAWLAVTDHWTWLHTGLVAASLLAPAVALAGVDLARARRAPVTA
ncbi:hypothetical protein LZ198_26615 [Myxococcus sp. K15C18031901]|uniref:hypothetical protein n=1 Tax=Myxococcus dinghuensis TaxID=2906761 RepID=UPI0020A7F95E|nr:hypothetical protein [Myxococcus dinghuensis]MCP3102451.1 hypothetical protein [Myxococcus dinghuensis]